MVNFILKDLVTQKKKIKLIYNIVIDYKEVEYFEDKSSLEIIELFNKYGENIKLLTALLVIHKMLNYLEFDKIHMIYKYNEKFQNSNKMQMELLSVYMKLKVQYNGYYFLEQNISPINIKEVQKEKIVEELNIYRGLK